MSAPAVLGPSSLPAVQIRAGALHLLKWIALATMTLDHVNYYVLGAKYPWMYQIGRLTMPLFGIVLAYNLARPGALEPDGISKRVMRRLAGFGLAAQVPFTLLRGGPWPPTLLNVMFMLLLTTAAITLIGRTPGNRFAAWALILVGGAFVEFWWIGIAVVTGFWWWFEKPSIDRTLLSMLTLACLCAVVQSFVPMLAPPLAYAAHRSRLVAPRAKMLFYAYYPAHLAAIAVVVHVGI